jgi:hypothetical protein
VSAIINAVGGYNNSNQKNAKQCFDTINGKQIPYWQDTVILITWDDWGGWYDHVLPWRCQPGPGGTCQGYPGGPNSSDYVYGFRVPLLVVSAYAKQGYISGKLPSPGEVPPYIHDVGSILNFIEYAFGQGGQPLGGTGGISPSYPYADHFAPDGPVVFPSSPYSLSDFFDFANQRTFTPLTQGINYKTQCFITPDTQGCFPGFTPSDPDADAVDQQD